MGTSGLGSLLVDEGLLTEADRRTIKRTCGSQGSAFARGIIAMGLLDEDELAAFLAEKTHWRVAPKELVAESRQDVWGVVDRPLIERLEVLPLKIENGSLHVAMVDPLDHDTVRQLAFFTGLKIHPVISTLSRIRAGLEMLLKGYKAPTSQLEDFLTNHASAASRQQRMHERLPTKKGAVAGRAPVAALEPVVSEESYDELTETATSSSSVAALEYPESVEAAETTPPTVSPSATVAMDDFEALDADDFGSVDDLDLLSEADEAPMAAAPAAPMPVPAAPMPVPAAPMPVPAAPIAEEPTDDAPEWSVAVADDPQDLAGLDDDLAEPASNVPASASAMDFGDADLEDNLDLSDLDPDTVVAPKDESASARDVDRLNDELSELDADLGAVIDDDLDGELTALVSAGDDLNADAELSADLAPAARGDDLDTILAGADSMETATDDVGEMGEIGELGDMDDFDLLAETTVAPASAPEELGTDGLMDDGLMDDGLMDDGLSLESPHTPAAPLALENDDLETADIPGELSMDDLEPSNEPDPFVGLDDMIASSPEPMVMDDPIGDVTPDPLPAGAPALEQQSAALNRALMSLSMAPGAFEGVRKAAAALSEAGLTRGLLLTLEGNIATPVAAWETVAGEVSTRKDRLAAYVTPGLVLALKRQFAGWTAFDTAREKDLHPFVQWTNGNHALLAAILPIAADRQLAIVTAWKNATRDDPALRTMALEVFRRVAKKL